MAEQKSVGRTLDYGLKADTLNRVKGATTSSVNVDLQKLKSRGAVIDSVTGAVGAVSSSLISGKAKTKELEEGWGEVLSTAPEDWGTVEAMENFKTSVSSSQEEYIACVRSGDKKCQERLLAELGSSVKGLQAIKDETVNMNRTYETEGHLTNTDIVDVNTQEENLLIGQNKNDFKVVDGQTVVVVDNTENIAKRISQPIAGQEDEWTGEEDLLELFPEGETARYLEFPGDEVEAASFEDDLKAWKEAGKDPTSKSGRGDRPKRKDAKYTEKEEKPPLTTEEIRALIKEDPKKFQMMLANGDIKIKMDVNAAQIKERNRQAAVPTATIDQVQSTLAKIQEGASASKATYFDPVNIRNLWASGFKRQDQNVMMTAEIGFGDGVTFEKDFMQSGELNIPIPIVPMSIPTTKDDGEGNAVAGDPFVPVDTDKSGTFEPGELMYDDDGDPKTPPIMYTLTEDDKKAVFKAMKEPENFDVAKQHFSEWATMRSAEVHNRGVMQRFVEDGGNPTSNTKASRKGAVPPEVTTTSMYGGMRDGAAGYYDPGAINPATGKRYDAQTMASSQLSSQDFTYTYDDGTAVNIESRAAE